MKYQVSILFLFAIFLPSFAQKRSDTLVIPPKVPNFGCGTAEAFWKNYYEKQELEFDKQYKKGSVKNCSIQFFEIKRKKWVLLDNIKPITINKITKPISKSFYNKIVKSFEKELKACDTKDYKE